MPKGGADFESALLKIDRKIDHKIDERAFYWTVLTRRKPTASKMLGTWGRRIPSLLSRGGTSATTALIANIHQRERELAEHLEKYQLITKAQLIQRISQEISKIQNNNLKDLQKKELEKEFHTGNSMISFIALLQNPESPEHVPEPSPFGTPRSAAPFHQSQKCFSRSPEPFCRTCFFL